MDPSLARRLSAEGIGTFWLVLGGCGTAVLAGDHVGFLGVALAFGLTILTMTYALGHISGGHFNPAVTVGQALAKRFPATDILPYLAAQVVGAVAAAAVLLVIANGRPDFAADGNFLAANGYGSEGSPDGYNLLAAAVTEVVLTFGFLLVVLGVTDARAHPALAGLTIGVALTLTYLISIPVTNGSINPARSIGPALFVGGTWLRALWLFVLAPLLGGGLAGLSYPGLFGHGRGDLRTG